MSELFSCKSPWVLDGEVSPASSLHLFLLSFEQGQRAALFLPSPRAEKLQ